MTNLREVRAREALRRRRRRIKKNINKGLKLIDFFHAERVRAAKMHEYWLEMSEAQKNPDGSLNQEILQMIQTTQLMEEAMKQAILGLLSAVEQSTNQ